MTDLDKLIELATRTGKLYAAPDVYDVITANIYARYRFDAHGLQLIKVKHLPSGTISAVDDYKIPFDLPVTFDTFQKGE